MPTPDAREPLELPPSRAGGDAGAGAGSGETEGAAARPGAAAADLGAVPAFLRGRLGSVGPAPSRGPAPGPAAPAAVDIATLPMLGIAPRRLILVGATILLAWLIASFGRQVAEASSASSRAEELRAANAALASEVAALERELQVIQDQRYISQAARAFRLGEPDEIPFALEAGAPPLPPDAPGSAAARLGAEPLSRSPLEGWLDVLFGPGG